MSNPSNVQYHAAEKFENWIISDWEIQMGVWRKAYEGLGTEFAQGYTDFYGALEKQRTNDEAERKANLAWALFALSILTAGAGPLISSALAETRMVTQVAAASGQTAAIELVKEKMSGDDGRARPGRYQAIAEQMFGGALPMDVRSLLKMNNDATTTPSYFSQLDTALKTVASIEQFNKGILRTFDAHVRSQKAQLVLMKDALTPSDNGVGERWLKEANGNEQRAKELVEEMITRVRHILFERWTYYGNNPWFTSWANREFEKTLWATWILRQSLKPVIMRQPELRPIIGAGHWERADYLTDLDRYIAVNVGGADEGKMLVIGKAIQRRFDKLGIIVPHSVSRAKKGDFIDPHRGIITVGDVDTPFESWMLIRWAKNFRPKLAVVDTPYMGRNRADTPPEALKRHAERPYNLQSRLGHPTDHR